MVANVPPADGPGGIGRRERAAIALAGAAPDIDGLGAIAEVLTKNSTPPLTWFSDYHHMLHNLLFALVVAGVALAVARRQRWLTAALALLSFHLHLLGDIVGARGPDGYGWPVLYLLPFSDWAWTWAGQWPLNGWQNFAITGVSILLTFYLAWRRGFSPLEMVSPKADRAFVAALRARFPVPAAS
jgi:hypothetical protein